MADKSNPHRQPEDVHAAFRGSVTVICGCMFSGKSKRLVEAISSARRAGKRVTAFKHAHDNRYAAAHIVTHDGERIDCVAVGEEKSLLRMGMQADVIAIDEAQFFSDEVVEVCRTLAANGRDVIVAGLDLDSWGQPFGPMPALQAIADHVVRTEATCARCGHPANRTQRLTPVVDQIMIGGAKMYEPRCESCFVPPPAELRC